MHSVSVVSYGIVFSLRCFVRSTSLQFLSRSSSLYYYWPHFIVAEAVCRGNIIEGLNIALKRDIFPPQLDTSTTAFNLPYLPRKATFFVLAIFSAVCLACRLHIKLICIDFPWAQSNIPSANLWSWNILRLSARN